jgi:hypothetical protein
MARRRSAPRAKDVAESVAVAGAGEALGGPSERPALGVVEGNLQPRQHSLLHRQCADRVAGGGLLRAAAREPHDQDGEAGEREPHSGEARTRRAPGPPAQLACRTAAVDQQALVKRSQVRRRRGTQVIAQRVHEAVVYEQRLRDVPLRREGLHDEPVRRLAVGRPLHKPAPTPFRAGRVAVGEGCAPLDLARVPAELLELDPPLVGPGPAAAGQQLILKDVRGFAGIVARGVVAALLQSTLGPVEMPRRDLHIDPDVVGQHEPQLPPPLDAVGAEHPPHAGQHGPQTDVAGRRRMVAPERLGETRAADRMAAMVDEVGEYDPSLPAGKPAVQALAGPVDGEAAAQPDPEARRRAGGRNHHGRGDGTPV